MKYWTLFTLRMLTRIGLIVSACLWLTCHGKATDVIFDMTTSYVEIDVTPTFVYAIWCPPDHVYGNPPPFGPAITPQVQLPGLIAWDHPGRERGLQIDHWFVCLTFLLATILTSVRWRRREATPSAPEQTGE